MNSSDSNLGGDKFADFNHKSRLISLTSAVASVRSATRFANTSDERSAPVVTSIRRWLLPAPARRLSPIVTHHWYITCHWFYLHRHVARHRLLPTTGASRVTGCHLPP
ncbi:hypothetical protein, partial [Burkholderia pseudomallei]|uniref:hypothetical protein n=1 Tax=Burkholderia pseudomallei TaxID=28450 RepID=UPI001C4D12A7